MRKRKGLKKTTYDSINRVLECANVGNIKIMRDPLKIYPFILRYDDEDEVDVEQAKRVVSKLLDGVQWGEVRK